MTKFFDAVQKVYQLKPGQEEADRLLGGRAWFRFFESHENVRKLQKFKHVSRHE